MNMAFTATLDQTITTTSVSNRNGIFFIAASRVNSHYFGSFCELGTDFGTYLLGNEMQQLPYLIMMYLF